MTLDDREAAFAALADRAEEIVNETTNGKNLYDIEEVRQAIYNLAMRLAQQEARAK
jgi:hypothetical protein